MIGLPEPMPQVGDVLLRSEECTSGYIVSPWCGQPQLRCSTYMAAFDAAKRWARAQHADVWFVDNDDTFVLLSRHRWDGQQIAAPC